MPRSRFVLAAVAVVTCALAGCSGSGTAAPRTSPSGQVSSSRDTPATIPSTPTHPSTPTRPSTPARPSSPKTSSPGTSTTTPTGTRRSLPLPLTTGDADQVITVVAPSSASTTAELQAWTKTPDGWRTHGPAVTAHVGSGGVGRASEGSTRTPAGSFTLTQAFGHDSDPGTRLPYVRTTPADWWISQSSSPLYNTRQRCSSGCAFTRGDPNEHLYYETPFYNYAVVIDYNTANAPGGVRPGAGSAFFLHVTDGNPTEGCVSIPQDRVVSILRWLSPTAHPRILIGVG